MIKVYSVKSLPKAMAEMRQMAKPLLTEVESWFEVKGMVCQNCVRKVETALRGLDPWEKQPWKA